jgi:hypothetical protein
MDDPVNFPALAALRPGEAIEALRAAVGARWRAPAPHDAGSVKAIAHTGGFEARIDVTGHVASLEFRPPFPADVPIAGLRLGMAQRAVLAAFSKLTVFFRTPVSAATHYVADVSDHYRMAVEFHGDELYGVRFFVRDAVYPEKGPMVYPPASGPPGAPFRDPNFKLAVLSALVEADALDLARPQDLADAVLPKHIDLGRDGYDFVREAYDYLVRYPLTDADLARVEAITFDGGEEIYRYCFYYWDGTSNEFDIASVEGIARCVNLRSFYNISMLQTVDLDHLVGLSRLEEIHLSCECRHPDRLLELPALKRLTYSGGAIGDWLLLARLRARGVSIRTWP